MSYIFYNIFRNNKFILELLIYYFGISLLPIDQQFERLENQLKELDIKWKIDLDELKYKFENDYNEFKMKQMKCNNSNYEFEIAMNLRKPHY